MSAWRAAAAAAALVIAATACGGDADDATPAPDAGTAPTASPAAISEATGDDAPDAVDENGTAASATAGTPVRFTAPDGQELAGTLYGDGPTGVVLAHMRGRDQGTWTTFAVEAADAGNQVLTFDFRGYGQSTGTRDTELPTDLRAAVDLMAGRGVDRIVVVGASMGGTAAVNVAARAELAGVATLSAPANFQGLEAAGVASDVGEPLLAIAAEGDGPYADDARAIAEAALTPSLEILSGSAHGTNLFTEHGDELTDLLLAFIAERSA